MPLLPANDCEAGAIAVAGDTSYRPVAPCGAGKWGNIPIDPGTVHVDSGYAGADANGSSSKPFASLAKALATAAPGALIAIAAGKYSGPLVVDRPLRIWGTCPEQVELASNASGKPVLTFAAGSEGSEAHAFALTGAGNGIEVVAGGAILLDRVFFHDLASGGVLAKSGSITIDGALFDRTIGAAVAVPPASEGLGGAVIASGS
jgi:hypothetical protein